MNGGGFAAAVAALLCPAAFPPRLSGKDRAVELARVALRQGDMMFTAAEAKLISHEYLRALGLRE